MGTPLRSKSFHDFYSHAETMGDDSLPDQVAGIRDLTAQYPWIDITRVGIWGHSGGGNATAALPRAERSAQALASLQARHGER